MRLLFAILLLFPLLAPAQPANDLCDSSITIAEFGCWDGDNTGAGDDVASCSGCQTPNCGRWDEVWFDITPTTSSLIYSLTGPSFSDMSIVLYSVPGSGCPGAGDDLQSDCGSAPIDGMFTGLVPGTTYYIAVSGIDNEQGEFSLCFGTALSVELTAFWGRDINGENHIHWTTASESNNDYFVVEKSRDGYSWKEVGRVDGAGNSSIKSTYKLIDEDPYDYSTYYRLKQVDLDGEYEYSDIIDVQNNSNVFYFYTKAPKDGFIYLSGNYYFEFYNSMGQVVRKGEGNKVNTNKLVPGIYILKIGTFTKKFYVG